MARQTSFTVGVINITVHPHSPEKYVSLFRDAFTENPPQPITSRIFRTFFWGLARLNSPLPEIRPSWEAFAHPRSGCLLWFLVTKRILSTHETSSHEDSAPTDHFRRAGARASKCPAGAELLKGRLVQRPHIKIAFSPPFVARDVPQSRAYQHKRGLAVRKIPDNSRPSSEFTVDPLKRVICADTAPVSLGKVVV